MSETALVKPEKRPPEGIGFSSGTRSEEHTSELQSLRHLVCRLLLEKKNAQSGELRIEPEEGLLETRHQGVRLRHREHPQHRVGVQAEIGRASHRIPRGIYRWRRALL